MIVMNFLKHLFCYVILAVALFIPVYLNLVEYSGYYRIFSFICLFILGAYLDYQKRKIVDSDDDDDDFYSMEEKPVVPPSLPPAQDELDLYELNQESFRKMMNDVEKEKLKR